MGEPRSDYVYFEIGNVVVLEDLDNGGRSVTNDVEQVLFELERDGVDVRHKKVVYRDSQGDWAQIHTTVTATGRRFGPLFPVFHDGGGHPPTRDRATGS